MTAMGGQLGLAYAFVEREIALSKRYWAWELVWLVYGIVTSLSVAYIGLALSQISGVAVDQATVSRTVLYLLVGTIAWRFLGIIFENIGEVIACAHFDLIRKAHSIAFDPTQPESCAHQSIHFDLLPAGWEPAKIERAIGFDPCVHITGFAPRA